MNGHGRSHTDPARTTEFVRTRHRIPLTLAFLALALANLTLRFWRLDSIPGINGDEAWYGVQVERWLAGQEWSAFTPSGLPINLMLFGSESLLLTWFDPSFWILRLPVALWSAGSVLLTGILHRWVFGDWVESVWAALFVACLPTHLAYSRFAWDPSFGFVAFALLLYGTLGLADAPRRALAYALVALGAAIAVSVHATNVLYVAACAAAAAWQHRLAIASWATRNPRAAALCVAIMLAAAAACLELVAGTQAGQSVHSRWISTPITPALLLAQLAAAGELVFGPRVYQFLAGVPRATAWAWTSAIIAVLAAGLIGRSYSIARRADALLIRIAVISLAFAVLVGPFLWFERPSFERYFLYLVPTFGLFVVRRLQVVRHPAAARWMIAGLAGGFLVQFWFHYGVALRDQSYAATLAPTFRTGAVEPKAAAVHELKARPELDAARLFAERWWLEYPVQYLLGTARAVSSELPHDRPGPDRVYVVGFAGDKYIEQVRHIAREKNWTVDMRTFSDRAGRPIVQLLEIR